MIELVKTFFKKPTRLLALLIFQAVLYWMIAIYLGSEAVPVAYQRF